MRAVDVHRGERWAGGSKTPTTIAAEADVARLVEMIVRAPVHRPEAHPAAEPRYWLTFWLTDGTSLTRLFFLETRELMGGLRMPEEFASLLRRHAPD